jgi:DNA repair protein RadC
MICPKGGVRDVAKESFSCFCGQCSEITSRQCSGAKDPWLPRTVAAHLIADEMMLADLLSFVVPDGDQHALAQKLIERFGSLAATIAAPPAELSRLLGSPGGVTHALKLVYAAALRLLQADLWFQPLLDRWDRVLDYLHAAMGRERIEHFRVLFLDNGHRLLADEVLARGTVDHAPVYPREVVKRAIELNATAMILAHNHPSGDPSPSREDIAITQDLISAARVFGIRIVDHVVVGNGRCISFRRKNLL